MANALIQNPVDRENHIVHGVKVLGFTSANGRIYDFAAVKEAIQKYEKAPVNKDHNMEEPSFSDRLGWLENVTLEKDGLYADFHYNPHADGIESFLWFAEHNGLGDVGFSHLVSGKYSVDPDGTERITRIDKVKSVDLVANPATTKTIFESEVKPMGKKIASENSYEDDYYPGENPDDHEVMMKNQKLLMQQRAAKKREEELKKSKGKKIAKEAGNAANKEKKNELDRKQGEDYMRKNADKFKPTPGFPNQLPADYDYKPAQKSFGRNVSKSTSKEQEGDSEMDNKKMMEEENPMQQEEAEQDPMMDEADDVYAKIKEICEGEGSDEEKSKQVLEMLGLSGGMSEGEEEPMEEAEEDPEAKNGSESDVLEVDDEEDEEEEPKKESKSELASLRKWKSEKLKEEKIVKLIKESNLEPTKVFIKQLSAIDSKLWSEAIRDRKKVALVKSSVKPISSGLQSRSESSYKQFLESVLGK